PSLLFNDPATTEVSTLSLHDALPIFSPTTRWRKVTTTSARTNPTTSATQYGAPRSLTTGVIQWCTAGLVMAPSARVHTVMPSWEDRKSTRLNSSHVKISYAVFCLKKK